MSVQSMDNKGEAGSLILAALLIFLILSIIGAALLSMAAMEKRMADYVYRSEEAQHAADAGIQWSIAKIDKELRGLDIETVDDFPNNPLGKTKQDIKLKLGDDIAIAELQMIKRELSSVDDSERYCRYSLSSCGTYRGAEKIIDAVIEYKTSEEGAMKGKVISYSSNSL